MINIKVAKAGCGEIDPVKSRIMKLFVEEQKFSYNIMEQKYIELFEKNHTREFWMELNHFYYRKNRFDKSLEMYEKLIDEQGEWFTNEFEFLSWIYM